MRQIYFAVLIPKRTRVDNAFNLFHQYRLAPRAFRFSGFHHEYSLIGISPEYVELTVVMPDAGSPYAVAVFRTFGCCNGRQRGRHGGADDRPVYEVFGVKNLQSRQTAEAG